MNTKFRILPVLLCLVMIIGLFSCEKKNDINVAGGKLKISLSMPGDSPALKSAQADSVINDTIVFSSFQLLLSVADVDGVYVFEDKLVPLYRFGDGFVSDQLEIKAGEFFLKKFMVLNNYGQVIYASPLEGSPRAYLVNQPLPIYFKINPEQTTQIAPEVLPVDGFTPADFGYVSFQVQVVRPVTVFMMAMLDNPLLMRPSLITDAVVFISTPDGWSHNFKLEPIVNKLELRYSEFYNMVVFKEGFPDVKLFVSARELLGTSETNPYVIKIGTPPFNTLVLQPGPEDGIDARITNLEPDKNFGNYKYFESTFLSEPVLTVMRSTRSLIFFKPGALPKSAIIEKVTLTLYYDIPVPWPDSVFNSKGPWDSSTPWYGAALQQVIDPWEESAVTWNNQPKTTEFNQVLIYPFIKNANFIDVDVTGFYKENPNTDPAVFPNYGMMLRLYPDDKFPGFRFASSDYPDSTLRPKLTISYSLPVIRLN
jgi:hypothetical protein